jgi:hypothetical protein
MVTSMVSQLLIYQNDFSAILMLSSHSYRQIQISPKIRISTPYLTCGSSTFGSHHYTKAIVDTTGDVLFTSLAYYMMVFSSCFAAANTVPQ